MYSQTTNRDQKHKYMFLGLFLLGEFCMDYLFYRFIRGMFLIVVIVEKTPYGVMGNDCQLDIKTT